MGKLGRAAGGGPITSKRNCVVKGRIRFGRRCRLAQWAHSDTFAEAGVLTVELDNLPNPLRGLLAIGVGKLAGVGFVNHQPLLHPLKQHDVFALGGAVFFAQFGYLDLANLESWLAVLKVGNAEVFAAVKIIKVVYI